MRRQIEMNAGRRSGKAPPDLSLLDDIVSPQVLDAMRTASAQLTKLGVRHALVGGLALGVHGYPRATKDVNFLVGEEVYQRFAGDLIGMAPGIPIAVGNVPVNPISAAPGEDHLHKALERPIPCSGIPVAPIEVLIYMKLKSPRNRDATDVLELIKVGAVPKSVDAYVRDIAPDLSAKLADLRQTAQKELEGD